MRLNGKTWGRVCFSVEGRWVGGGEGVGEGLEFCDSSEFCLLNVTFC